MLENGVPFGKGRHGLAISLIKVKDCAIATASYLTLAHPQLEFLKV